MLSDEASPLRSEPDKELLQERIDILKKGNMESIQESFDNQDWMQGYKVLDFWCDQTQIHGSWRCSWHLKIETPEHGVLEYSCAEDIYTKEKYGGKGTHWGIDGEWMYAQGYYEVRIGPDNILHCDFLNGASGDYIHSLIECYADEVACMINLEHAYKNLAGKRIVIKGACADHIIAETEDGWDVIMLRHPPERMNKMLGLSLPLVGWSSKT